MTEQYGIERRGHCVEVEADESLILVARARLFVDGRLADERSTLSTTRLHGELRDGQQTRPVRVAVSFGLFGGVARCVLIEDGTEYPMNGEGGPVLASVPSPTKANEGASSRGPFGPVAA